jgi:hypothetical protein
MTASVFVERLRRAGVDQRWEPPVPRVKVSMRALRRVKVSMRALRRVKVSMRALRFISALTGASAVTTA